MYTDDFSTLYTNIPHSDLKEKMKWIVNKAMSNDSKKFTHIYKYEASLYKKNEK